MNYRPEQLILSRLLAELNNVRSIGLGTGIPALLRPHAGDLVAIRNLDESQNTGRFDLVISEASEISPEGYILAARPEDQSGWETDRLIIATIHCDENGRTKLVEKLSAPSPLPTRADLVVTELGVIAITDLGFELREVAPGLSSDDVRKQTAASLHVRDDLRVMLLQ